MEMITKNSKLTSLEVLEQINLFRKEEGNKENLRHDNLLNIIRDEFEEEISLLKIKESEYTNTRGKKYPMFNLELNQAKQILMRESKFVRKNMIIYIENLENKIKGNQFKVPTTFIEAMQLATETLIVNEQLTVENKKLENKINILVHTNKLYTASELASEIGFKSAIELNKKLAEMKFQHYVNGVWVVNAKYSKMGYVSIKQNVLESGKIVYDRKFTGMGREYLIEKFLNKKKEITKI